MNVALPAISVSANSSIYEILNLPKEDLWVFAYGSLMWDPGFPFLESMKARIYGYHRALCIRSVRYRGTSKVPGLVFGLDRGGSCTGVGFQIDVKNQREVAEYLQDREMLNNVYTPSIRSISLDDGRSVQAIAFVVKQRHPSYVRDLTTDQAASIVANASGQRGANLDYVISTLNTLETIGIIDRTLSTVGKLAKAHAGNQYGSSDG